MSESTKTGTITPWPCVIWKGELEEISHPDREPRDSRAVRIVQKNPGGKIFIETMSKDFMNNEKWIVASSSMDRDILVKCILDFWTQLSI